jgi:hypothetical protein
METVEVPQPKQRKSRDYRKEWERTKQRIAEDPELKAKKYQATARRNKERYQTDPEYHKKHNEHVNSYNKRCREAYKMYKEALNKDKVE